MRHAIVNPDRHVHGAPKARGLDIQYEAINLTIPAEMSSYVCMVSA